MLTFTAAILVVGVIIYTLGVRAEDLPEPEPVSPVKHLEDRKAAIYENLRDLQFEYRTGKLSDEDYTQTKKGLQAELAAVLAQIEAAGGVAAPVAQPQPEPAPAPGACPHCGAKFPTPMKFCGECGKPMLVEAK
ncbi:MAG TPA: hypothetical protein PLA43_11085 [Bryobacteraceae bacterium]|nr:hypothetical protein [Bryobacteraceae bacterium]HOL70923.1 hypothetical protein [Bryobacteraceae bacterium]HOQ47125.1 hypothetical protein [Bryobacteraceae bacterium]HPQ16898.1 hypothetical protein [Bryobacteraceae bacterium]HPU72492.1 hypothetical protein [Bryobacteraceae bacterium]